MMKMEEKSMMKIVERTKKRQMSLQERRSVGSGRTKNADIQPTVKKNTQNNAKQC